jgi:hypothetical protein
MMSMARANRFLFACSLAAPVVLAAQSPPAASVERIVIVDASGAQIATPVESDPVPRVRLDTVRREDVLIRSPLRADVRISGMVTDELADVVPGHEADIKDVEVVGHQRLPVVPVRAAPTAVRPFAFVGQFSGTVSLDLGSDREVIAVEALNAVHRLGADTVALVFKADIHLPTEVTTGSLHVLKGLGPFTLQLSPLRRDAPDTAAFFLGARIAPGQETRLVETGPDTRRFTGRSAQLGDVTLSLEDPFYADDPSKEETLRIRLSSSAEIVVDEELPLQQTGATSDRFQSRAGRLPNDAMLRVDYSRLDDRAVDVLRVQPGSYKAFFGLEPMGAVVALRETSAASRVFEGRVPGLGVTRIAVEGIVEGLLHLTIDSSDAGVTGYRMRLDHDNKGYYIDADMPREHYTLPPTSPDSTVLVAIERSTNVERSSFFPFWVVAPGLRQAGPADYGEFDGRRFELTTEPLSVGSASSGARSRLPIVMLRDPGQLRAPNVVRFRAGRHQISLVIADR